jgi:hypothetical protein
MNRQPTPKSRWRPALLRAVFGCLAGILFGTVLGLLTSVGILLLYTKTLSRAEFQHRYGDMVGVAMIQWGFSGMLIGGLVLGALGIWWGIWDSRGAEGTSSDRR